MALFETVVTDEAGYKEQDKTVKDQAQIVAQQQQEIARLTAANLAVQQQLADLAKVQMVQLEAAVQHFAATQAFGAPDAVGVSFRDQGEWIATSKRQ